LSPTAQRTIRVFIVDNVLLCPFKSLMWIFREIHDTALQDSRNEAEATRLELGQLYRSLETGAISEADFDLRERQLLDRLDAIEARSGETAQEDETEQEEVNESS
jgi:hypothetical protein